MAEQVKVYYTGSPDHVADAGTWTKPAGAVAVRVILIGAGGGGGGGDTQASGVAATGGGGGGGGARLEAFFQASDLGGTGRKFWQCRNRIGRQYWDGWR